jgi:FtsP/CotA-like multicopper oxidase with cupredoxin domain
MMVSSVVSVLRPADTNYLKNPLSSHYANGDLSDLAICIQRLICVFIYRYHTPAVDLLNGRAAGDATLINGLGRYPGGPKSRLAVVRGKRYRLRLVSMSCDPNFVFSIDGHNLTVIEADGVSLQPETVDHVQIYAGESILPDIPLKLD